MVLVTLLSKKKLFLLILIETINITVSSKLKVT